MRSIARTAVASTASRSVLANGRWPLMAVDGTGRVVAEREYEDHDGFEEARHELWALLRETDAVPELRVVE